MKKDTVTGRIMKKTNIILGAIASIFVLSCTKTQPVQKVDNLKGSAIIAVVEQHDAVTKTGLSGTSVFWCAGDAITVFTNASEKAEYTTTESGASVEFTTTAELTGSPVYALYPYQADASISGSVITFTVPTTQTYAENSFGNGANIAVGKFAGESVEFKNACGVLRLNLSVPEGQAAKVGRIELFDPTNNLAGTFTVDAESGFTATCTSGTKKITLDCGEGVDLSTTAKAFNIVVPVGSLSDGFTAEVYSKENHLITTLSTVNDNAPARRQVKIMSEKTLSWLPEGFTEYRYLECQTLGSINSGLYADNNTGVDIKFKYNSLPSSNYAWYIMGSYPEGESRFSPLFIDSYNTPNNVFAYTSTHAFSKTEIASEDTNVHSYQYNYRNSHQVVFDSEDKGTVTPESGSCSNPIYLFNRDASSKTGDFRIYRVAFSQSDIVSADMLPCVRTFDSTPGMYDMVRNIFLDKNGNISAGSDPTGDN